MRAGDAANGGARYVVDRHVVVMARMRLVGLVLCYLLAGSPKLHLLSHRVVHQRLMVLACFSHDANDLHTISRLRILIVLQDLAFGPLTRALTPRLFES